MKKVDESEVRKMSREQKVRYYNKRLETLKKNIRANFAKYKLKRTEMRESACIDNLRKYLASIGIDDEKIETIEDMVILECGQDCKRYKQYIKKAYEEANKMYESDVNDELTPKEEFFQAGIIKKITDLVETTN